LLCAAAAAAAAAAAGMNPSMTKKIIN
jgi:hypothetical protein